MAKIAKDVKLTRMGQPMFISLVGVGANQTAFRIVRDDSGGTPRIKRVRRADALLSISFEDGLSEEDVNNVLVDYGLTGYTISQVDNHFVVTRDDVKELPADTLQIGIGNGRVATILKPISRSDKESKIVVSSILFDKDCFETEESVSTWLSNNDIQQTAISDTDIQTIITRHELTEDIETKQIKIDTGVTFVIARADTQDIPGAYIQVVNEAAYGSWGWGQLDFGAYLANIEFCEVSREGLYALDEILRNILFYSELPIASRKQLVSRALQQFSDFIGSLLDALPARVIIANPTKEINMANDTKQTKTSDQKDDKKVDDKKVDDKIGDTKAETITRDDVIAIVNETLKEPLTALTALKESIDALKDVGVKRDDKPADDKQGVKSDDKKDDTASAFTQVTSGLEQVVRSIKELGDSVQKINERVANVEGATVLRNDGGDGKQAKGDIFKGMFGKRDAA